MAPHFVADRHGGIWYVTDTCNLCPYCGNYDGTNHDCGRRITITPAGLSVIVNVNEPPDLLGWYNILRPRAPIAVLPRMECMASRLRRPRVLAHIDAPRHKRKRFLQALRGAA